MADLIVAPTLAALRECLGAELEHTLRGPVCRVAVRHAAGIPVGDGCGCECAPDPDTGVAGQGDAWVRLVQLVPDALIPGGGSSCPAGWSAVIELGALRCVPLSEDGSALPAEVVEATAMEMLSDLNAMVRVLCCSVLRDRDVTVDYYLPIGPAGNCAGGALQFRVALPSGPGGC
jgi:hypothetical protein